MWVLAGGILRGKLNSSASDALCSHPLHLAKRRVMTKVIVLMSGVAGRTQEPEGQEKGKCSVWGVIGISFYGFQSR